MFHSESQQCLTRVPLSRLLVRIIRANVLYIRETLILISSPGPDNVSVWTWLFESEVGRAALSGTRGFHDAATGEYLSFCDVKYKSISASTALAQSYGLKPGQTVAIICRNSVWYPVAMFSALRLGAVVSALPQEAKADDLAYYLRAGKAAVVYADSTSIDEVRRACQIVGLASDRIISLDGSVQGQPTLQQLITADSTVARSEQTEAWKPRGSASKECAMLCFSSGTTGLPKAVRIS